MHIAPPDPARGPLYLRRLTSKILRAFDQACVQQDLEVARLLLACLDRALRESKLPLPLRRTLAEHVHAAHEKLWCLRHVEAMEQELTPICLS